MEIINEFEGPQGSREAQLNRDFNSFIDVLGTPIYHEKINDFLTPRLCTIYDDIRFLKTSKSQVTLNISLNELEKIIKIISGGYRITLG